MDLKTTQKKLLRITEYPFLVLCALYIFRMALATTTLAIGLPTVINRVVYNLLIVVVVIRAICQFRDKRLWAAVALGILYFALWDASILRYIALMTIGCVGISYRKALLSFLIAAGSAIAGTILFAMSGSITSFVTLWKGHLRSYLGIISPTDLGSILFLLMLAAWVCLRKIPTGLSLWLPIVYFAVVYSLWISRTGMLCSSCLILMILYLVFDQTIIDKNDGLKWIRKTVDFLAQAAFPICMLFAFAASFYYAKGLPYANKLNILLSGRLADNARYLSELKITLFGYEFPQKGNGGSVFAPKDYTFIDVTYLRIFFMYGIVTLAVMCILWVFFTRRALKNNDRRLAFALALIAIQSVSEHHFMEVNYNFFLILPFASMDPLESHVPQPFGAWPRFDMRRCVKPAVWAVGICCSLLLLPRLLSCLSVWSGRLGDASESRLPLLLGVILLAWTVILLIWSLGVWADSLSRGKAAKKRSWCVAGACIVLLAALSIVNGAVMKAGTDEYAALLAEDAGAIQVITEGKTGKLYASELSELYVSEFSGVSRSVFSGEDLARYKNATVIVPAKKDSAVFTGRGFLYSRISDAHAVYTNDQNAAAALQAAGYSVTGYCSAMNDVELEQKEGDIVLIPVVDGAVHLGGDNGIKNFVSFLKLSGRSDVDFFPGRYTVTFRISIDPVPYDSDYAVCRLAVTASADEKILRNTIVYRSWFDEYGRLDEKLVFSTDGYPAIVFSVMMLDDSELCLNGIMWQRTPQYDVHSAYDEQGLKLTDTYYDSSGNPTMNRDGYAMCSFEYNENRTVTAIHYFDTEGRPVATKYGYSDLNRDIDGNGRWMRETYCDPSGSLVLTNQGYAVVEWAYDEAGNVSEVRYYDAGRNPVLTKAGYSVIRREYDEDGRMTAEWYYDTEGKHAVLPDGYSGTRRGYDETGRLTDVVYMDREGNPVNILRGYAMVSRSYNESDQLIREEYRDAAGEPVNTVCGYSSREMLYDGAGRLWLCRYFDVEGMPSTVAQVRCEYDEYDRLKEARFLDALGNPASAELGIASVAPEYDDLNEISKITCYDMDGKVILVSDEAAKEVLEGFGLTR